MSAFLDTNVLLHLFSGDQQKANRAEELTAASAVVSAQVLNEFVAVARRKLAMSWPPVAGRSTAKTCTTDSGSAAH